jgi:tRNA pseudouridine38-40 synthase
MRIVVNLAKRLINKSILLKHTMSTEAAITSTPIKSEKRELEIETNELETKKVKLEESNGEQVVKKRKYALLIGYNGQGYFGLQRNSTNKSHRTIEDEIVDALVKVGSIPQQHADEMFKMSFNRAARTDKGVSAVANLLSLKMEMHDDTLKKINELLPKQIRVFGYRKVTQSFDSKTNCDARTYKYVLPTFALCPIEDTTSENYRITKETLNEMNSVLKMYHGTHNYHNFTSGKKFIDPSAKRYIISMECSEPFIRDNIEFVVITVKGQSFMLHQIRKMVGLAIAVCRGIINLMRN